MSWSARSEEQIYTEEEIELRLKEQLPHWYLEKGWIRCKGAGKK